MNAGLDRELNIRFIVGFALVLTVITVGLAALMWSTSGLLVGNLKAQDPAPSPLPAARVQPLPPGPLLQADPESELASMRAEEDLLLSGYGWVDREAGIARVPIEAAIELLAGQPREEKDN